MKQLIPLGIVSLAFSACLTQPASDERPGVQSVSEALDNGPLPPADNSCHVTNWDTGHGPIIDGTKDSSFWCCGESLCADPDSCGYDYGEYVYSCVDCHFYECLPGPGHVTPPPPIHRPPGGVYGP